VLLDLNKSINVVVQFSVPQGLDQLNFYHVQMIYLDRITVIVHFN
jgi:hypothetical protein